MTLRNVLALVAVLVMAAMAASTVGAQTPAFANGTGVARALERHFNGADYKARLARSGGRLTSSVLCAHDRPLVVCTGRMRASGLNVRANWTLTKLSPSRARLSWVFTSAGVPSRGRLLIAPSEIGLRRF